MIKTIKIPVNFNPIVLKDQASRYAQVFNHVVSFGLDNSITNAVELHHKTYYTFANRDFLPSQLIISARTKAAETIHGWLTAKKKRDKQILKQQEKIAKGKHFRKILQPITRPVSKGVAAVRYDARSFNIDFKTKIISFSSINGRQRISFNANPYYEQYYSGKVCSADLAWSKKNNTFFFHVVLEFSDPVLPEPLKVLGVDLGLNNLAVSSNGQFYMKHSVRDRVAKLRGLKSRLQSKGTPSAKRHLKVVSGREHRFRRDVNHCATKQIVRQAKILGYDTI
ncbi:MAG: transposase, partial [Candidatus Saganbacteria bacterium]|nr:transposase [Candidatus Saganbacteria bacterium]